MATLWKTCLHLYFALVLCVSSVVESYVRKKQRQYVVSFNVQLRQVEQQQYLSKHFPLDSFEYVFRNYVSIDIPSDFAVIKTSHSHEDWLASFSCTDNCSGSDSNTYWGSINGIHEDSSLAQSRQLHSDEGSEWGGERDAADYTFSPASLSSLFSAMGVRGQGVKVAVFDTGLTRGHPSFLHIPYERTDWTGEGELNDFLGHGTFVAGVIAGADKQCPGIAPEVDLHVFRIFNKAQKAYTSWFLDAFNYAMYLGIDVINLSIGGPDYGDLPFVDKIDELAANGIIVVSAVGNEGPVWGTLHNPADQNSVIGVGGWRDHDTSTREGGEKRGDDEKGEVLKDSERSDERGPFSSGEVASFSSRGMTLWNTRPRVKSHTTRSKYASSSGAGKEEKEPSDNKENENDSSSGSGSVAVNHIGMGRVKPDILAPSYRLSSSSHQAPFSCRTLSGTSVANPVVVASIALLLSSLSQQPMQRAAVANVAAMKQILMASANPLRGFSVFEQGSGVLNLTAAHATLLAHKPHVSVIPSHISNFKEDCPYLWPWCGQSLFASSQPLMATMTILNSIASTGHVARIQWVEASSLGIFSDDVSFRISKDVPLHAQDAQSTFAVSLRTPLLTIRIQAVRTLWPWAGTMEVQVTVNTGPAATHHSFLGEVRCNLLITIQTTTIINAAHAKNSKAKHEDGKRKTAQVTFRLHVTPPPPREKRILWDVFHSIAFPSAFVPSDNPSDPRTKLDLLGDHPYTNYRDAYLHLQRLGYNVEILRKPWTCFEANLYAVLVLCDLEEELSPVETSKLETDVRLHGLSVLVIADWFDETGMLEGTLLDDNTHTRWFPITGGSNIPAVNKFLGRFDIQFGLQAFKGSIRYKSSMIELQTANTLATWPAGGYLWRAQAGQLTPLFGGNLRAQFGTRQAFAGFLQVKTAQLSAGRKVGRQRENDDDDDDDGYDADAALQYREGGGLEEAGSGHLSFAAEDTKRGNVSKLYKAKAVEESGGRIAAIGDSAFVDSSSFEQNSIYGSFKLLEELVSFLAGKGQEGTGATGGPVRGSWSSLPELLMEDFHDARLTTAFSSFSAVSTEKLQREKVLRQREFQRYSSLLLHYYDHDHDHDSEYDGFEFGRSKKQKRDSGDGDVNGDHTGKFLPLEEFCSAF